MSRTPWPIHKTTAAQAEDRRAPSIVDLTSTSKTIARIVANLRVATDYDPVIQAQDTVYTAPGVQLVGRKVVARRRTRDVLDDPTGYAPRACGGAHPVRAPCVPGRRAEGACRDAAIGNWRGTSPRADAPPPTPSGSSLGSRVAVA